MSETPSDPSARPSLTRRVAGLTRGSEAVRTVTLIRTVKAAPSQVWAALSDPAEDSRWFRPVGDALTPGERYRMTGGGGEVEAVVEAERLSMTWERDGAVDHVEVSLRPTPGGTLLQLDHQVAADDPGLAADGPTPIGLAWELALTGLAGRWTADEVDLSSATDGWARAAIADGADPATAHDQAARAAAVYGG